MKHYISSAKFFVCAFVLVNFMTYYSQVFVTMACLKRVAIAFLWGKRVIT